MPTANAKKSKTSKTLPGKQSKEFILKKANDHNVRFIRLWFSDILGQLKSFAITIDELEGVMNEGAGFDGGFKNKQGAHSEVLDLWIIRRLP